MNTSLIIVLFFFMLCSEAKYLQRPMNQGSKLLEHRLSQLQKSPNPVPMSEPEMLIDHDWLAARIRESESCGSNKEDHFLKQGLPGQPLSTLGLRQFAGNLNVDVKSGRSLFYYFVESQSDSASKPLVLWLQGGPGCSSLMGAFTEIGPFGVNPDGETLYARKFAWNRAANMLFLESPAIVGFSYSNTTSDYDVLGDKRTAEDTLVFLVTWLAKYPQYQGRDFYLAGESYAGYYIPELADVILNYSRDSYSANPIMNLKGFMIGNGLIDDVSDTIGSIDFAWTHMLISREIRQEFLNACSNGGFDASPACQVAYNDTLWSLGDLNPFDIYKPICNPLSVTNESSGGGSFIDRCDLLYLIKYLNQPKVQEAINANRTRLSYPWSTCITPQMNHVWRDTPLNMFPFYRRLIKHGLHILLYSGDLDLIVPAISTSYALEAFGLRIVKRWSPWSVQPENPVAGYHMIYDGLTFATVLGASHEVSQSHADILYTMFIKLLNNELL